MQVYKTFFKIARSKLPSALIYLFIFLVLTIFMSNTAPEESGKFQVSSVDICIIDNGHSTASQALSDYLTGIHHPVELDSYDRETLQDNLYYQQISYILTIPEGFEQRLLTGETDVLVQTSKRPDSTSGYFVDQQVESYLKSLTLYLTGGASLEDAITSIQKSIAEEPGVTSLSFGANSQEEQSNMYYFYQYLPYVLLMILIEGLSPILMAFHKKELDSRMSCSSLLPARKNMQIGLGCLTYSFTAWLVFICISILMYGPSHIFSTNGLLCILNSLVFTLIATSITLFIGIFHMNNNILSMTANVIGLGMSFLCGIFVPQWYLGENVIAFSRFLPAYWYIRINNMLSGFSEEVFSMETYLTCIGVQILFLLAIFSAYLVFSRQRQKGSLA